MKFLSKFSLPKIEKYTSDESVIKKAQEITKYFYYLLVGLAVVNLEYYFYHSSRPNFTPTPLLEFLNQVSYQVLVDVVLLTFTAFSLIGAIFYSSRWARILAFIGILIFHTFKSSFGQPNLTYILWLYVSGLFIFLPDIGKVMGVIERKKLLVILIGAQALVLLTYSMSGLSKVWGIGEQILMGNSVNGLLPQALSLYVGDWWNTNGSIGILGPLILENPYLGWPMHLLALYLELFAIFAIVRPNLQRIWAIGLIAFHLGTYALMRIEFAPPMLLLLLLFINSPFQNKFGKEILFELPIFGFILGKIWRTR